MLRFLRLPALLLAPVAGGRAVANGLPPMTTSAAHASLFVELVLNGQDKGVILRMTLRDGHPIVDADELAAAGLPLGRTGPIDLTTAPDIKVDYDAAGQRLRIDAAPSLLPTSHIAAPDRQRTETIASTGAMLNYMLYVQHSGSLTSALLWSEQRLFGAFGTVSNNGTLITASGEGPRVAYRRYDTRYRFVNDDGAFGVTVGDLITRSLPWTSAVRMGGIELARDFRVRPDLLTMPLPSFAGETAVPTAVDLFVDGFRQQRAEVAPGRFVLDRMPVVNGAGEASIVTTDAVGRQIVTTIPFYVASNLLRPGLLDGGGEIGFLRRGYGLRNFDYGTVAASASLRFGLTSQVTIEGHGEATPHFGLVGGGIDWAPGRFGVIDLAASASRRGDATGRQLTIGYTYASRVFTVSAQHIERSSGYRDLGTFELADYGGMRASNRLVATTSLAGFGAVGAAFVSGRTAGSQRTQLGSVSYSRPLGGYASLFASVDHDFISRSTSAQLRLIVPFGRSSVSGGISYDPGRHALGQIDYQRAVRSDGGLGVTASIASSTTGAAYGQASAQWRGRLVDFQAGGAIADGRGSMWGSASGTLVALDRHLFVANQVSDAFAVVSSDGVAGVPISYENQPVGNTDRRGYLFVPSITAYHPGRFALDPLALDADYAAPVVETRVALDAGAGAVVHMPVHRSRSVQVTLVEADGRTLAAGAVATRARKQIAQVGWDGLLFLPDAADSEELDIRRTDGSRCHAHVAIPAAIRSLSTIGPIPCV